MQPAVVDHRFLSGFSEAQKNRLATLAKEVTFEEDALVLVVGERSTDFYLLTSGSVGIEVVTGSCIARVQAVGPGDAFGWSSLLQGCDTLFQVRARERCKAWRLDGAEVSGLCREDPAFGVEFLTAVLRLVAGRLHGAEAKIAELCGAEIRSE